MTASSATGVGAGSSNKPTSGQLATLANGPKVYFSGKTSSDVSEPPSSPPSNNTGSVVFPYSLPGGFSNYVVILTSLNGGSAYVVDYSEDEENNFTGFSFITESSCDLMYVVIDTGVRPVVVS
jgi:hypothetical protein